MTRQYKSLEGLKIALVYPPYGPVKNEPAFVRLKKIMVFFHRYLYCMLQ